MTPSEHSTLHALLGWLEAEAECSCLDSDAYADQETGHVESCGRHHSARLRSVLQESSLTPLRDELADLMARADEVA